MELYQQAWNIIYNLMPINQILSYIFHLLIIRDLYILQFPRMLIICLDHLHFPLFHFKKSFLNPLFSYIIQEVKVYCWKNWQFRNLSIKYILMMKALCFQASNPYEVFLDYVNTIMLLLIELYKIELSKVIAY